MNVRNLTLIYILLTSPSALFAQKSFALYGGYSDTANTNVTITDYPFIGYITSYDEPINGSSNVLGIKYMAWFDPDDNDWLDPNNTLQNSFNFAWLGFSADLYGFRSQGENTKATSVAISIDILFRYPHKIFQPYFGFGFIHHSTTLHVSDQSELGYPVDGSNDGNGIDLRAGLNVAVYHGLSLFAEYRSISLSYSESAENLWFGGQTLHMSLETKQYVGGIAYDF